MHGSFLQEDKSNVKSKSFGKTVTHIRSKLTICVLDHRDPLPRNQIPMDIAHVLTYSKDGRYLPVIHVDLLGSRLDDMVPVNASITEIPVAFTYAPISFGKLRLWMQFSGALHTLRQMGFTDKDIDELKGIFNDTNIFFLCVTFFVAAVHVILLFTHN